MLVIDCHCHYGKGDGFTGPWDTNAPLPGFMDRSKKAGIHKTVLFAAMHSDYSKANLEVARMVNKHPHQFYGFAFIHAARDAGRIETMIEKAVRQYHFCGIKLHRRDARITREVCEAARKFCLPILYDVLGESTSVELFASEYRDVDFIIPHLGSFADDWHAQLVFIDQLVRHPNVYTDSSGVKRFDLLEMAYKRAGASKILFGSDGPWMHPGLELQKIFELRPGKEDLKSMLAGNFLRLTGKQKKPMDHVSTDLSFSR
ncbi:MAG: amidohydrolase family protein [Chitinophagaceae bacterium]|nr:amidohydrolase family protein [Chitinophagaceae bacterium]